VKIPSSFYVAILTVVLFISSAFGQNPSVAAKSDPKTGKDAATVSKSAKTVTGETVEQDVAEALSVIESNYITGKHINYNEVFKSSIDSMLHTLDPHSNYFDAKEFEQFRTDRPPLLRDRCNDRRSERSERL
jgi:carboxyl-terminal processing protease